MRKLYGLILLGLLGLTLSACDDWSRTSPYARYTHLSSWSELDQMSVDGLWIVYFYLDRCAACLGIEDDVLNFATQYGSQIPLYFVNSGRVDDDPPAGVRRVPTLLIYDGDELIEIVTNEPIILRRLNTLAEGMYAGQLDYDDFTHFAHWDDYLDIEHETMWMIYYYANQCTACDNIRQDIFSFSANQLIDIPVYFVNADTIEGDVPFNLIATPSLVVFRPGLPLRIEPQVTPTLLDRLRDGTYN
ncbi:MAG: thioredoxin family protein [Acholeplasmatales bacterium]|nr:MAG: thioredoxin family protein [Acholeplasmatales bacterium]